MPTTKKVTKTKTKLKIKVGKQVTFEWPHRGSKSKQKKQLQGVVKYYGETELPSDKKGNMWVGIAMDAPVGNSDGCVICVFFCSL